MTRKSGRGSKRGIDKISDESMSLLEDDSYSFKPKNLSDLTVHYQSKSYHVHQYVLVTMSKYFATALISAKADDSCLSNYCTSREKCHRCVTLEGNQIGGCIVSTNDLLQFFYHMYASTNTSSECEELIDASFKPASLSDWPDDREYYMAIIRSTDPLTDTASLDFYLLNGIRKYEMIGAVSDHHQSKLSYDEVGACFESTEFSNHPNLHLADYFQADSMMKQYETQAELVIAAGNNLFSVAWKIIHIAERYGWSSVRSKCIPICAKDNELSDEWEKYALKLKPQTLVEILKASRR